MRLDYLSVFVKTVDAGSINKAAKSLYLSQPSITTILKNIEKELGLTLLNRSHTGITLTPEGKVVYDGAKKMLAIEKSWYELNNETNYQDNVQILVIPSVSQEFLKQFLMKARQIYPKAMISIKESRRSSHVYKELDDRARIAIMAYFNNDTTALNAFCGKHHYRYTPLFKDEFYILMSKDCPLMQKPSISKADLAPYRFALCPEKNDEVSHPHYAQFFKKENLLFLPNFHFVMETVSANEALAVSTNHFAQNNIMVQNHLIYQRTLADDQFESAYCLLYPDETIIRPLEDKLKDLLLTIFSE